MNFRDRNILAVFALAVVLFLATGAKCSASEFTQQFFHAFDRNDEETMVAIVAENQATVPDEIKLLVEKALLAQSQDEKDADFNVAELMAKIYREISGNSAPLLDVKKKSFDAKLTMTQHPVMADGVYVIELPKAVPNEKNIFRPNNIVIKKGSTVRWVNKDENEHIFATMPLISKGTVSSPRVAPGGNWEQKFDETGEYFYICFIHHSMIGKITVEE